MPPTLMGEQTSRHQHHMSKLVLCRFLPDKAFDFNLFKQIPSAAMPGHISQHIWSDGRFGKAKVLFSEVMETTKMVRGPEHPDKFTLMVRLASTYRNQGRRKEVEDLEVEVMEMTKRVLGEEHPVTLTSMANLALTYRIKDDGKRPKIWGLKGWR